MLSRVDPYNSQILTAQDMPQFIAEIEATAAQNEDRGVGALLDDLLVLGRRCAAEPGMELHLDGD
ncbi:hypothetical protein AB0I66_36225 [Streptomyces sp. NPDC050439]|uniref:hypothetical protein n=1 Tax=unclassified Streptomyces TaxID=2593676 RepID=UPI003433EED2